MSQLQESQQSDCIQQFEKAMPDYDEDLEKDTGGYDEMKARQLDSIKRQNK
jgi:hypothetical protein